MSEPELVEEVTCIKKGKEIGFIQVLTYGDGLIDIAITYADELLPITEIETISINQYKRITDLCRYFKLGHEKR